MMLIDGPAAYSLILSLRGARIISCICGSAKAPIGTGPASRSPKLLTRIPCARAWIPWLYSCITSAKTKARTGHQNGTKLFTPGISSRSLAGRYSSGGAIAVLIAVSTSSATTPSMTKRQSQIDISPKPRQNLLFREIFSSTSWPCLVRIIRTIPSTLETPNLSRDPLSSRYSRPKYHSPATATPHSGIPSE